MSVALLDAEDDVRKQITVLVVAALKQAASLPNGVEVTDYLLDALRALDLHKEDASEIEAHHTV